MAHNGLILGLGILLGFLSGVFGVGGSSVATPLLRLLGVPRLIALATPLPVTIPTALVGAWTYWRRGLVNLPAALWTAAGGVPAVVAGSYLTTRVPGRVLMLLTGAFVLAAGIRLLRGAHPIHPSGKPAPLGMLHFTALRFTALGVATGFLSGLLANGGGFLLVPAYLLLFRMEPQESAATSLVAVALLALPGTWVHWRLGHVDAGLAALLAGGVIPSTYVGARVGMRLPRERARLCFAWFLLLFGLFFLGRTIVRGEELGWGN